MRLAFSRKRFKNANYVDDVYPFIWRNFSHAGYVTLYGEDAFALGLLSHDDINLVEVEDEDLANTLKEMHEKGELDNTVRLPFFSIALPEAFRKTERGKKMYDNLLKNKDRFLDRADERTATHHSYARSRCCRTPSIPIYGSTQHLFKAGVEPHWCTCLNWKSALDNPEDKAVSEKLAHAVVAVINRQLKDVFHLCAVLSLKELMEAKKLVPNEGLLKYKNVKDNDGFVPDFGVQVTLFYDFKASEVHIDLTSISHPNKFGDMPHCIINENYFLATFCVCHDKVVQS
ncbi:unnamed protein product [Nippostrongylus brasiliensis]|uniref:Uncharacterized protein n=1 Tax=Nippostrongylus brasiliensis TaxID=27835 RepID=A0A3P7B4J0_NIPBR|nr:unnamed protein product [Nippostrongylus brasiliensis]